MPSWPVSARRTRLAVSGDVCSILARASSGRSQKCFCAHSRSCLSWFNVSCVQPGARMMRITSSFTSNVPSMIWTIPPQYGQPPDTVTALIVPPVTSPKPTPPRTSLTIRPQPRHFPGIPTMTLSDHVACVRDTKMRDPAGVRTSGVELTLFGHRHSWRAPTPWRRRTAMSRGPG